MAADSQFVVEDYQPSVRGRLRRSWDALQASLRQNVETVTRSSVIDIAGTGVEDINPPEDIDEYHQQYQDTGIVRANLNQYVQDVTKPGLRVEADSDATEAYFMGGDGAPESTPEGGFLENCAILNETHQPFNGTFFDLVILNKYTRGTNLIEYAKADLDDAESQITGFKLIPPETVSARTYNNTNLLLDPDPDADRNQGIDPQLTARGEVAAYIQFDEESIVNRRFRRTNGQRGRSFAETDDRPLSQNDLLKQVLDPDIGGGDNESGIFGTSIIQSVTEEITEYNEIKRDRAKAIKTKAYGIWDASFQTEVIETPEEAIIQEWDADDQDAWISDVESLGPGEIIGHDGSISLEKFEGSVPQVEDALGQLAEDIIAPLPAPKFLTGFEDDVNRDVTSEQNPRYQDTIDEERTAQARSWTQAFRKVAERHPDLDPSGVKAVVQPPPEESPILSLEQEDIEKINTWVGAASAAAGPTLGPTALFDEDFLRTEIFQVPEDAGPGGGVDEDTMAGFDEATRETFERVTGLDAYQDTRYSEGDPVETPDGFGVVSEIRTEPFEDVNDEELDASEDSPVYVVALESEDKTVGFYRASELDATDLPETEPENPEETLAALFDIDDATVDAYQEGFFEWPQSWKDSPQPARLIALKAWAGMGGRFTSCRREMAGQIASPSRFCADFKDRILGWEGWRQGG